MSLTSMKAGAGFIFFHSEYFIYSRSNLAPTTKSSLRGSIHSPRALLDV